MSSLSHTISLYLSLSLWVCRRVSQGAVMPCSRAQRKTRGIPDQGTRVPAVDSTHPAASSRHAPCAIQQQDTVMVLLDASAIARNVGRDLVFAANRRAACSHSDLGCANYGAEALPA